MIHFNSNEKDICVIFIHGMCQTIISNYFATVWGSILSKNNIGFFYEHNRGHSIENDTLMKDGSYARYGCMYEIFEDCILDIDFIRDTKMIAERICKHYNLGELINQKHIEIGYEDFNMVISITFSRC